jgi:malonyl-ACP O-methyltransferase BioC
MSFDKKIISQNFSRQIQNYDEHAIIQGRAAKKLTEIILPLVKNNAKILDIGSGTSFISKNFLQSKLSQKNIKIFEIDLAFEMLRYWNDKPKNIFSTQADLEKIPFKKKSFDVIISSFSLQWINDFEENFSYFFSLLKDDGILAFAMPIDESLSELKLAKIFKINNFTTYNNISQSLDKSNFNKINFFTEIQKEFFVNGVSALKAIKIIGANYSQKQESLITKTQLQQFNNFCLKNYSTKDKNIYVSWKILYSLSKKNI